MRQNHISSAMVQFIYIYDCTIALGDFFVDLLKNLAYFRLDKSVIK